ncbi:hypothetical protein PsYK624_139500 [Phanerochaete sordida]|uniref:DUF6533 domain-containing protein n=1 Tax=Phanerochaete sordida TaxID=48140 RepID=A0A9P3GQR5_9APHY|nr:hypothetical protein PsYK624_139500 [Phanerochaete sordida]
MASMLSTVFSFMTPHTPPPDAPILIPAAALASGYRLTNALWTCSYVVLVYDYVLTLDDEISFIWTGGWTRARMLYLVDRYWPIVNLIPSIISLNLDSPPAKFCDFCYAWFTFSNLVTQFTTTLILILRLYAMFGSCKKLLIFLLSLQISLLTLQGTMTIFMTGGAKLMPLSHVSGCLPGHWVLRPWVYGMPAAVLDTTLFSLVTIKSLQYFLRQETRTPELFVVMLADSMLYFASVFAILVANLLMWQFGGATLFVALPQTLIVAHSIIGCRMLLNVRKTIYPWHGMPWRDEDTAVFSAVIRPLSFFRSAAHTLLPTSQNDAPQ